MSADQVNKDAVAGDGSASNMASCALRWKTVQELKASPYRARALADGLYTAENLSTSTPH